MKKINSLGLLLIMILFMVVSGCKKEAEIKIIVPEGMPYIAIGGMIGKKNVTVDVVSGSSALKAAFVSKEYDIIVAPFNLGVQLYNKKQSSYKVDGIIGLNNLYIISQPEFELKTLADIKKSDKPLLAFGQGSTPAIMLNEVLALNGIQHEVEYMNSVNDVMPFFVSKNYDVVLTSEPILTIMKKNKGLEFNSINLQKYIDIPIIQVAVFANGDEARNSRLTKVLTQVRECVAENTKDPLKYAEELVDKDDYFAEIGSKTLSECSQNGNIKFIKATNYRIEINKYLTTIGYETPDDFFYRK